MRVPKSLLFHFHILSKKRPVRFSFFPKLYDEYLMERDIK